MLGPFTVGDNARVAAGAVVLDAVPEGATAVGVPARVVRINGNKVQHESEVLNQRDYPDIVRAELAALQKRITQLEERAHDFSRGGGEDDYE